MDRYRIPYYVHKAAVVGDTVDDPFKDTSGPLNFLLKLMPIISLVFGRKLALLDDHDYTNYRYSIVIEYTDNIFYQRVEYFIVMSKLRTVPTPKDKQKSKITSSPERVFQYNEANKFKISSLQLEATFLSKQLSIQIEKKDQYIHQLREENIHLQNTIQSLKSNKSEKAIKRLRKIPILNTVANNKLIENDSMYAQDEIDVIREVCQKIQGIMDQSLYKDLAAITKIGRQFQTILKRDPNSNKKVEESISQLEKNINKLTEKFLQEQLSKNFIDFKEILKKEREALKGALQQIINANMKNINEELQKIKANQLELLSSLPACIKQLKDVSKKREQNYKNQIAFLEKKIISMGEENRQIIDSQNTLIQQLRESLANLKQVYNKQIQIPLLSIRQTVEREINQIKSQFSKMHRNSTLNRMIESLIDTLNRYTESKNHTNNTQMHDQIKKINQKLSVVNEQSIKTINQVREIIDNSRQITFDSQLIAKSRQKEESIIMKKKEKEEIGLQIRIDKQKEYIDMLERYNKKLEQSVMRTQQQNGKSLYQDWKSIQEVYRVRQKELENKLSSIDASVNTSKSQIIEIKKTALAILQTERSLAALFQSFESEIASIKSFKDELFNFLENQLKFRHQINQQVDLFNKIFVQEYSKLSQLQLLIPKSERLESMNEISHNELHDALSASISEYNKFKQDYESIFKDKVSGDIKLHKYCSSIAKLQDEYTKLAKNKTQKLTIELNFQPLKVYINSVITKAEDLAVNTRTTKDIFVKVVSNLKNEFLITVQEFQKIMKFVKQSRLHDTIKIAYQLFEGKNHILHDISQILSQFARQKDQRDYQLIQQQLFEDNQC